MRSSFVEVVIAVGQAEASLEGDGDLLGRILGVLFRAEAIEDANGLLFLELGDEGSKLMLVAEGRDLIEQRFDRACRLASSVSVLSVQAAKKSPYLRCERGALGLARRPASARCRAGSDCARTAR